MMYSDVAATGAAAGAGVTSPMGEACATPAVPQIIAAANPSAVKRLADFETDILTRFLISPMLVRQSDSGVTYAYAHCGRAPRIRRPIAAPRDWGPPRPDRAQASEAPLPTLQRMKLCLPHTSSLR